MAERLQQPSNPYDPAWVEYRRQNPGIRLSLSAADPSDGGTGDDGGNGGGGNGGALQADYSFIPDSFKKDDGSYDTEGFANAYNDLNAFKSQYDERTAALPQKAEDYAFQIGEDFKFPEGFDAAKFQQPVLDDDGKEVLVDGKVKMRDFEAKDLIDANDPDLPLLQAALHQHQAPQELMGQLAEIMAGRELRAMTDLMKTADDEIKALGPDGQSRIDVVNRSLAAKVGTEKAKAIADGITSADALRGMEEILKPGSGTPPPAHDSGPDLDNMSNDELIELGMKQQMAGNR